MKTTPLGVKYPEGADPFPLAPKLEVMAQSIDSVMATWTNKVSNYYDAMKATPLGQMYQGSLDAAAAAKSSQASASQSATDARAAAQLVGAPAGDAVKAAGDARYLRVYPVTAYGAKGDGTTDDTAAIRAAVTAITESGAPGTLHFPPGDYAVRLTEGQTLMAFTGQRGVSITGDRARLVDTTTYTNNGPFTCMALWDNCTDVSWDGVEYVGPKLSSPTTLHGYQGAIVARAVNGTSGVRVDLRATNARYGVQTGEYGDPSEGQCRDLDVTVRGTMIGYPLAAYYADNIRHTIDVDGIHRAAYIAGCIGVRGTVHWRDQYIADTAYLITDVLVAGTDAAAQANPSTAPTTSRGCANIDATVIDKGSTVFQASTMCAAISLSRVDPVTFRNIRLNVAVAKTSDTISTTVGCFRIASSAKSVQSRYPYNWEQTVALEDISVTMTADHTGQTKAGNTAGDFYVVTYDGSHYCTVRNLTLAGTIRKAPSETRADYYQAPGIAGSCTTAMTHDGTITIYTNPNVPTTWSGKYRTLDVAGLSGGSPITLANAVVDKIVNGTNPVLNTISLGSAYIGGTGPLRKVADYTMDLAASATWTGAIPQGAVVQSVSSRVVEAITGGATYYSLGVTADTKRYSTGTAVAAGSTSGIRSYATTETGPRNYTAATDLVVGGIGGSITGGKLRVVVVYDLYPIPTA